MLGAVRHEVQVQAGEPIGVGEDVDLDDPATDHREREDRERATVGGPRHAPRDAVRVASTQTGTDGTLNHGLTIAALLLCCNA